MTVHTQALESMVVSYVEGHAAFVSSTVCLEVFRQDCGFGVAVVMMGGVRAVDYDYGQDSSVSSSKEV